MKKYLALVTVVISVWGCQETSLKSKTQVQLTNDEILRLPLLDNNFAYTPEKGQELALKLASQFLTSKDGIKRTISNLITVPSLYTTTGKTLIKTDFSISKPQTPSMYIANFSDKKGFVIISADKRAPEIIATVGSGGIDSTAHIGLRIFLENAIKHIDEKVAKLESFRGDASYNSLVEKFHMNSDQTNKSIDGGRVEQLACTVTVDTEPYNSVLSTNYISTPLLKTLWDQGPPFNNGQPDGGCYSTGYCGANTKYLAGCVAVAEGQVVSYFYAKKNLGDWAATTAAQTGCFFNANQSSEVSGLLHAIYLDYGIYVSRSCGSTGAGLEIGDISVTNPYGISPTFGLVSGEWRSWNTGDIRNSLAQGSPVVICGTLHLCCFIYCWGCGGGHEWVIDGMRDNNLTITYQVTTSYSGGSGNCPPTSVAYYNTTSTISTQIHQNWGWGPGTGSDANDWYDQGCFQSNMQSTSDINFDHANYIVAYITPL